MQARSGLIGVTGTPASGPTPVGAAIVDQHGGALIAMGILGALVRRHRDGKGTRVEASLINSGVDLQGEALVNFLAGKKTREVLEREKNLATWFHEAPYGVYPASDGHVVISLCEPKVLAEALDSDILRENVDIDRFAKRDAYACMIAEATAKFSGDELADRFDANGIWWSPVRYYDELLDDPQLRHAQVFREVEVRGQIVHLVNHPNRYDGEVPGLRVLALEIGEHSREVLAEHGYEGDEIEKLIQTGAIVAANSDVTSI